MPIHVEVDGTTRPVRADTLKVTDRLRGRGTARFIVEDEGAVLALEEGTPIEVFDAADALIWSGVVDDVETEVRRPEPVTAFHVVTAVDNHYFADKKIVATSYEGQTTDFIAGDIRTNWLNEEGITAGTIDSGPTVIAEIFNYIPASKALDIVAELAGHCWWIDKNKALQFRDPTSNAAPWTFTDADLAILSRGRPSQKPPKLKLGNPEYRNRQYLRGGRDLTDAQTEIQHGDGEAQSFTIGFPIAKVPTVEIDTGSGFTSQTVGIKGVDSGKQWYWAKGDPVVTQELSDTPLSATDRIRVTYQGEFDVVAVVEDPAEVSRRSGVEGAGSGKVEAVTDVPDVTSAEEAFEKGGALLVRFGTKGRRIKLRTTRTGLAVGQSLTVDLDSYDTPDAMLITEITTFDVAGAELWYDVTAVFGAVDQTWAVFMGELGRLAAERFVVRDNIDEQNAVAILAGPFSETWTWGESIVTSVFACPVSASSTIVSASLIVC